MKFRAWLNENIDIIMFNLDCGIDILIREEYYV